MKDSNGIASAIGTTLMVTLLLSSMLQAVFAQEGPRGPWVDEVTFSVEVDEAKVIDMLMKGDIQAYFSDLSNPDAFRRVRESEGLWYATSFGVYYELTFNPVGPEFPATGRLNPFAIPRIREAMNYAVDRKYIAEEIMGGLGVPRLLPIAPYSPDYARLIDVVRKLELKYRYDLELARQIIAEEMLKLGAELVDGKWMYKGEPVKITILSRIEDERRAIGDYVAAQLRSLGFEVEVQPRTGREAVLTWLAGDPADGKWHIYTGGWITTSLARDEGGNFDNFYTPRGLPSPLWQAYDPDLQFDELARRLAQRDFSSIDERMTMMSKALELALRDSVRVFLVHKTSVWVARKEITLAYDLVGGFPGARLWPYTIRYVDKVGGSIRIVSNNLLVEPWNPIGGSNWIYDQMIIRATSDPAMMPDPFTGLFYPNKVKSAEVTVVRGVPVTKTLDWVKLGFADEIVVPSDAWYGWDAKAKRIINPPEGTKAKAKVVITYSDDLFETRYHDGTVMSLADFVFDFVLTFERADESSPLFDESYVPLFKAFRETFKGMKIISDDPLVIEIYTDATFLDAEWMAEYAASMFYPEASFGPAPWHVITIGALAEQQKKLAFTKDKADKLNVEQVNYIAGPAIPILREMLDKAIADVFIPFEEVLGKYVSREEAIARYQALKSWFEEKGHFWVGNGPFYLDRVDAIAKIVTIKAFRKYQYRADRWATLSHPRIPTVDVSGPDLVVQFRPARFTTSITEGGRPYSIRDIGSVKYIVVGPDGQVVLVGEARPVRDGEWEIMLSPEETAVMREGPNRIEVVVTSKLVGIPAIAETSFTVKGFEEAFGSEIEEMRRELEIEIARIENKVSSALSAAEGIVSEIKELRNSFSIMTTLVSVSIVIAVISITMVSIMFIRGRHGSS